MNFIPKNGYFLHIKYSVYPIPIKEIKDVRAYKGIKYSNYFFLSKAETESLIRKI